MMSEPRDMSRVYRYSKTEDLEELRSRKMVRARRLERSVSYLDKQELRRIRFNVKQIDVELAARAAQERLL